MSTSDERKETRERVARHRAKKKLEEAGYVITEKPAYGSLSLKTKEAVEEKEPPFAPELSDDEVVELSLDEDKFFAWWVRCEVQDAFQKHLLSRKNDPLAEFFLTKEYAFNRELNIHSRNAKRQGVPLGIYIAEKIGDTKLRAQMVLAYESGEPFAAPEGSQK